MIVQKYLVQQGICSRKEADDFLRAGLIYVNGEKAVPGKPLEPTDVVTLDPTVQKALDAKITVAIYKPRGIMCSRAKEEGKNIFDIFPQYKHLNAVGRLDKESEGLLLLSNHGLITKQVTGDTHSTEKEYAITTAEEVFVGKLEPMVKGMTLNDGPTLPAHIEVIHKHAFRITLREGRNRQIRRMCGQLGLTVTSLKRIRIGHISLGDMHPGDSRQLTVAEVKNLL